MTFDSTIWQTVKPLCDRGAHFVPVRDKTPLCAWRVPLAFDTLKAFVEAHNCELAVVPGSLGLAVLDIDKGDSEAITRECRPICTAKTTRGEHLYYRADREITGYTFKTDDAQGEVLINNYAVLRSSTTLFHIWRAIKNKDKSATLPDLPRATARAERTARNIEQAQIGERNTTLFNELRFWAYRNIPKGAEFEDVKNATRQQGRYINKHFADPLPQKEVHATADSITRFCISNRNTYNGLINYLEHIKETDPVRYRDMKREGQKAQAKSRRLKSRERDKAIMVDLAQGLTQRAVAQKHGVSLGTVVKVKKRESAKAKAQKPKNTRTKTYATN